MKKYYLLFWLFLSSVVIAQVPGAFSLVAPTNGAWVNNKPYFDWGTSSSANYYQLYIDGILKKDNITISYYQIMTGEELSAGLHTWYVKAVNSSGNTQSNETWSILVDDTPPTTFDLLNPTDNSWTNNLRPTFQWSASSDANSSLSKYQLWIDGTLNRDNISSSATSTTPISDLTNGSHTWSVKAIDVAGNVRNSNQTWIIKIDNLPPGIINRWASISGSGSYVKIPSNQSLNPSNELTIDAWVYFVSGGTNDPRIVSKGWYLQDNTGYEVFLGGTGTTRSVRFFLGLLTGRVLLTSSVNLNAHTWYHISCVYDGYYMYLFINGVLNNSKSTTGGLIANNSRSLDIGRGSARTQDQFEGYIDEVRIWNIAKSPDDNKNGILNGDEPGLVGNWRFNEISGNVAYDNSTYGNNGSYQFSGTTNSWPTGLVINSLTNLKNPINANYFSNDKPTFTWKATSDSGIGFSKYQLYIDDILKADNLTDTSYLITTPLSYGYHKWYLKGFDLLGNNQKSPLGAFNIDNLPPNPFNLISPTDSQIVSLPTPNLSWQSTTDSSGGSGLSKYQLWINGVVNRDSIPVGSTTTTPSSTLSQGAYNWFIKAYDKVGNVRQSNQRIFYVDYEPPTPFTLISPANGDTAKVRRPTFVWHASRDIGSGLVRYELNISGQPIITVSPTDTSKQITFDLPDGNYNWFVKAFDRGNASTSSNTNLLVVSVPIPPLPPQLTYPPNNAQLGDDLTPDLAWNTVPNASYFHVQVAYDSLFTNITAQNTQVNTLNWTPTLSYYGNYFWRVKTFSTQGVWGDWSEVRKFNISLAIPNLLSPVNNSVNLPINIQLKWNRSLNSNTFKLQVASDPLFANLILSDSTITDTLKELTFLNNNSIYYWRINAKNNSGVSGWSKTWNFKTIIATPIVPILVNPLNNSSNQPIQLTLIWNKSLNSETYRLQLSKDSLFTQLVYNDSTIIDTTKQISALDNYTKYYWRVKAKNIGGISDWSLVWNFTTASMIGWCNLQWPGNATITKGDSITIFAQIWADGVTNSSGQGPGINAWIGYSSTNTNPSTWINWIPAIFNTDAGNTDEYKATIGQSFSKGTYYCASKFQLNAGAFKYGGFNTTGGGFWDSISNRSGVLVIKAKPINVPKNLVAISYQIKKVKLTWADSSNNETNFIVQRKQGDSSSTNTYNIIATLPADTTTYIDSVDLQDSTKYTYRVYAQNSDTTSDYSNLAQVTTITKILSELEIPKSYTLSQNYPNPFNPTTKIKFALPERAKVNLSIFNVLGEKVAELVNGEVETGYHETQWNATSHPSGIYLYQLTTGRFREVRKMIMIK